MLCVRSTVRSPSDAADAAVASAEHAACSTSASIFWRLSNLMSAVLCAGLPASCCGWREADLGLGLQGGSRGGEQKKRSVAAVDDKRMRALAAAMVRESERETLQGIRLELEQVCVALHCRWSTMDL